MRIDITANFENNNFKKWQFTPFTNEGKHANSRYLDAPPSERMWNKISVKTLDPENCVISNYVPNMAPPGGRIRNSGISIIDYNTETLIFFSFQWGIEGRHWGKTYFFVLILLKVFYYRI